MYSRESVLRNVRFHLDRCMHKRAKWICRTVTLGWYRFWSDLGYPAGALLAGVVSAQFGLVCAVYFAGGLMFTSGVVAAWSMTGATRQKVEVDDAESARMRVGAPRRA